MLHEKQSNIRNPFTVSHQCISVQPFPQKQGSFVGNGYLGGPMPNVPFSPLALYAEHDTRDMGIFLWSVRVSRSSCVPFFLCIPSLHIDRAVWETNHTSMLCKHCSAVTKHPDCQQYFFIINPKHRQHILLWRTSALAKTSTIVKRWS